MHQALVGSNLASGEEPRDLGATDPVPAVFRSARPAIHRSIKHVTSIIAGFVLGGIAFLAVALAVSTHFSGGQLGILGHPIMSVLSGSMAPTIDTGDLVIDKRLTAIQAANLHTGQIISFRSGSGGQIFTHRIAAVERLPGGAVGYVTKGDANDSRDGPVAASTNVVGVYQSKIPGGGYVLNALHRPLVVGLLVASLLLWLLSEPLLNWARQPEGPSEANAMEGEPK